MSRAVVMGVGHLRAMAAYRTRAAALPGSRAVVFVPTPVVVELFRLQQHVAAVDDSPDRAEALLREASP
ncbi:hypothetical protein BH683_003250 [Williamsia sp. 1138]|uniref:Gfo/Idh/MocA family oxidoreductase n=1 Tax=Gordonia rubripertincta TaxID=36822 RepID=A0ABT4MVB4_GORRU|nr:MULTISPECIES: hypothetical protein [Mycobacteriales]MCZ4550749.1 hypothetical protein [Gordonia rubripertincta]OZG30546.1 hypothetical protein BH683_003250 [Williamsia sp. 1138]